MESSKVRDQEKRLRRCTESWGVPPRSQLSNVVEFLQRKQAKFSLPEILRSRKEKDKRLRKVV